MEMVLCSRCDGDNYVKNGIVGGLQRYRCKDCGCNFRMVKPKGRPAGVKALAVVLYSLGRMSYDMIGTVFGVSGVAVYKWVRAAAEALPEPHAPSGLQDIQLDEMHHFLVSKKK